MVIDLESLTKVSRQLDVSMGSMMGLVDAFAVLMFMILIYLLSKIIIEKNAQSISMVKILGYSNREISRLYIRIDIDHGGTVLAVEPAGGILGNGISVPGGDAGEYQRMDYILYRASRLYQDVPSRNRNICGGGSVRIPQDLSGTDG